MIRFIFRELSTEDLVRASGTSDRLYRVAQHHLYLAERGLLVRGGHDTAATVVAAFDVRDARSAYLTDVRDIGRDVPEQLWRDRLEPLDVLYVGYRRSVQYADLPADGLHRVLSGTRAGRVCFDNVLMTVDDVADVVSALGRDAGPDGAAGPPPVFRCSFDNADDGRVLSLLDAVECTCAGLLSEFRVMVRRPAPRAYAVYPAAGVGGRVDDYEDATDDCDGADDGRGPELPESLLAFTVADCAGLRASQYRRLAVSCPRLRRLRLNGARRADDDGFRAVAAMPSLVHLDVDGLCNVSSDGLLNGKFQFPFNRHCRLF